MRIALLRALVVPGVILGVTAGPSLAANLSCLNPASGSRWTVTIDYQRHLADSFPADIRDREITWHNVADGGYYALDRRSGALTITRASSTGGYAIFDHCDGVK